ncbi:PoNe immunity protein domain-containing protein [Pseudorhodoferax sp.]|uniref:PoNe immunity protein domain-containing protein n=1 Tax=Pseudorhodoferax sp. TaxID=1993553 RepID=UPI0039E3FD22
MQGKIVNRRQKFLTEVGYAELEREIADAIELFGRQPAASGQTVEEGWLISTRQVAWSHFERLILRYTAGEEIAGLRGSLESAIAAFERYAEQLWAQSKDRNDLAFEFSYIDHYCALFQIVGLCFLLHRRDLVPRLAALQDGLDAVGQKGQGMGGADWIFEEFMSFAMGPENRYESETMHWARPYEALADALSSEDNAAAVKDLDRFLKRWYKDLAGTGWHDSHKPNEKGEQGGYYGYWSFEAGAAVLLLGIEDDSCLHKYLCYPKDMVAWARTHAVLSNADLRVDCGCGCTP